MAGFNFLSILPLELTSHPFFFMKPSHISRRQGSAETDWLWWQMADRKPMLWLAFLSCPVSTYWLCFAEHRALGQSVKPVVTCCWCCLVSKHRQKQCWQWKSLVNHDIQHHSRLTVLIQNYNLMISTSNFFMSNSC